MGVEDEFARFKVPPEVAIAQRSRRKKKGISEDVHLEDVSESLVHGVSGDAGRGLFGTRQFRLDVLNSESKVGIAFYIFRTAGDAENAVTCFHHWPKRCVMNPPILSIAPDTPRSDENRIAPKITKKTKSRKFRDRRLKNPFSIALIKHPLKNQGLSVSVGDDFGFAGSPIDSMRSRSTYDTSPPCLYQIPIRSSQAASASTRTPLFSLM